MTEIEKLSQVKFNNMHRAYCEAKKNDCTNCPLRVYCFISPRERTDQLMIDVIQFMLEELNPDVDVNTLPDFYTSVKMVCPAEIHFKGAVGYEQIFKSGAKS